jgi:transposase-like protein
MNTAPMTRKKRDKNDTGRTIAQKIIDEYQPKNVDEMQDALKDIFGPMFEAMLQGEMDSHLGYKSNERGGKSTDNRRNGYIQKNVKTKFGEVPVSVPRDRDASFEPQTIPKRTRDVSGIEDKVLAMYARGMSQRDIQATIDDIYGFEISAETVSNITDRVLDQVDEWQNRPLKKFLHIPFRGLHVCDHPQGV